MSFRTRLFVPTIAFAACSAAVLASPAAEACGGLFCSNNNQVNQTAERIIFAQNDDDTVTAAIEIMYEGPAHEFAWVLPVPPGEISVGVSSQQALDRLDSSSNPIYQLNTTFAEDCSVPMAGSDGAAPGNPPPSGPAGEGVDIVAEGNAGPYQWAQIMLDKDLPNAGDVAVDWLEENGFDVTSLGGDLLGEYLEDEMNLVAFKLQKGKNAGSVRPVLLTYQGKKPMVPIKPTAVAANLNMGVKVWVLGDSRAIPTNYRHLELNEGMINWFNPNQTYNDVIIAAADQAGGHGFVTEQAGPAGAFTDRMYTSFDEQNWETLKTGKFGSMQEFLQTANQSFGAYDGFADVISDPEVVPLRDGATAIQFLSCVSCYFETDVAVKNEAYPSTDYGGEDDPINSLNVMLFLNEIHRLVIEPIELTAALFDQNSAVTRFYTTLSPDEMDTDPVFDFNPELPDVDNVHIAEQTLQCTDGSPGWSIKLPQGMIIEGDGRNWPIDIDSEFPANVRISQLGTSGEGEIIEDNAKEIGDLLTNLGIGEATPTLMDPPMGKPPKDPDAPKDPNDPDVMDPDDPDGEPEDPVGDGPDIDGVDNNGSTDVHVADGGCSVHAKGRGGADFAWLSLLGLAFLRRRRH